ncbi:hypothetical protein E5678_08115 [Hydrogenophaga sp. PAMC20947]|nr:hypothetical protein E5678_08115 [Hydrogenophaga sp. PAMC20947]
MNSCPHAPPLRGSLPPGGADPAWGGPAPDRLRPHAPPLRGSLPPGGLIRLGGGPAPDRLRPHAPPLRGSLPHGGLIQLGAALRRIVCAPTLHRCAGRCPPGG